MNTERSRCTIPRQLRPCERQRPMSVHLPRESAPPPRARPTSASHGMKLLAGLLAIAAGGAGMAIPPPR